MSVDDLVYSLFNSELYQFRIDEAEYCKLNEIPSDILIRTVNCWESITNDEYVFSYYLEIYTWNYFQDQLISGLELVCFNDNQLDAMIKSGTSLSNITDITLDIDAVKALYSGQGYNKDKARPIIYDYYANRLTEKLNNLILNGGE